MAQDALLDGSHINGAMVEGLDTVIKSPASKSEREARKYRHVAAIHKRSQTSCLSHDSETVPSFLGFRNLLVLVVSEYSLSRSTQLIVEVVMNLRLVLENHMKVGGRRGWQS